MDWLWKWLCRLSYRKLTSQHLRKAPVGLPRMRDPDNICHAYEPRPRELNDFRDCQGDGHYLCEECCHFAKEDERAAANEGR